MKHGLRGMKHESNDIMSRITKIKTNSCQENCQSPRGKKKCLEVPIPSSLYETLPSTKYLQCPRAAFTAVWYRRRLITLQKRSCWGRKTQAPFPSLRWPLKLTSPPKTLNESKGHEKSVQEHTLKTWLLYCKWSPPWPWHFKAYFLAIYFTFYMTSSLTFYLTSSLTFYLAFFSTFT